MKVIIEFETDEEPVFETHVGRAEQGRMYSPVDCLGYMVPFHGLRVTTSSDQMRLLKITAVKS